MEPLLSGCHTDDVGSSKMAMDHYYGLIPAALMICTALSLSLSTKRANSGCVMEIGSPPCLATQSRSSCPASTLAISFVSVFITLLGVPAGTHIPYQIGKSNPASPASMIVGTSGSKVERCVVVTPNAISVPSWIADRTSEIGAMQ